MRPWYRWVDNIKMDLQKWVEGACECGNEPSESINVGEGIS